MYCVDWQGDDWVDESFFSAVDGLADLTNVLVELVVGFGERHGFDFVHEGVANGRYFIFLRESGFENGPCSGDIWL